MSWGAVIIGGSALVGGLVSSNASKKAAQAQTGAAGAANDLEWQMYQQNREDLTPWREAGAEAVGQLRELTAPGGEFSKPFQMGEWTQDPGYQFRLSEGMKALERAGSARGMSLSGAQLKALNRYNQDFASNEYSNVYNRTYNQFLNERSNRFNQLAALAGIGQTSAGQLAGLGSQTAGHMGQNLMNVGNAQAASNLAQANAWTGALNTGVNQWLNYKAMNQ